MKRPELLIRRLIILEGIQENLRHEVVQIKAQMRSEDLKIIDGKDSAMDIWIQYKDCALLDEALFMRKMLNVEVAGLAKRTGMITGAY